MPVFGTLILVEVSRVSPFFVFCQIRLLNLCQFLMWSRGRRFPRKLGSLFGKSYLSVLTLWIGLVRKKTLLVSLFSCMPCQKVEEDLDHLFWNCQYARALWSSFLQELGVNIAGSRSVRAMIEEFLLHLPFNDKGSFLWVARVCAISWDIWAR